MLTSSAESSKALRLGDWSSAPAVKRPRTIVTSESLGWAGFDMRVGTNEGCELDSVLIGGHYVGIHLNDNTIKVEIGSEHGWSRLDNLPRSIWIIPEGIPYSVRHCEYSHWAGAVIHPSLLNYIIGRPVTLRRTYVASDDLMSHLFFALVEQVTAKEPNIVSDSRISEGIVKSLLVVLGANYSGPVIQAGGISAYQLKSLFDWVEQNIGEKLTVEAMAQHVGLCTGHFSRAFKRSTRLTPWEYVLQVRAKLARKYLEQGESGDSVAFRCGFTDQAHLCRTVKSRLGLLPSEIRKLGT